VPSADARARLFRTLARARRGTRRRVAMPPKETVLDLARFIDRGVRVKLSGGREVTGTLKGYDQLLNLVLDEAIEHLRDAEDALKISDETRALGLLVCRGTSVMVVSALDSMEEIANPFLAEDGGAI
jgi:U6 snRNA-associated Sm-like protein LSm7